MARISGVELNDNWRICYALTRIKGIGWQLSERVLAKAAVLPERRVKSLAAEEIAKITAEIDKYPTEGELTRSVRTNISRLVAIGSYRGHRHSHNLPVRGQRTKSNARTKRGKRKTVGAFKKEILSTQRTAAAKPAESPKK